MMKSTLRLVYGFCLLLSLFIAGCQNNEQVKTKIQKSATLEKSENEEGEDEENEEYDGPMERYLMELEKTKDPALGYVPVERLWNAIEYTRFQKQNYRGNSLLAGIWEERGPSFDSAGPSGNSRGLTRNEGYTAGRVRAVLVDIADPTGNTVFTGGVCGGLWKCTNFLSATPNWQAIDDYFDNMAISYMCQNPANPDVMYFCTGEPSSNADAVLGRGVWKSVNHGATWTQLPSTVNFVRGFRILCDNSGNVYLASRTSSSTTTGLFRSNNGGTTFSNITPLGVPTICTDIEISSTGRLHASFGYATAATTVAYRYTDNAAGVTSLLGWESGIGLPTSAGRIELATKGDTLYAAPTNASNNIVSTYRSFDGGANWVQNNTSNYTTSLTNGQGWYNITLAINPNNATQIMIGGLDMYRSLDTGKTVQRRTYWAGNTPYVHADHHFMQWWNVEGETRILIGNDGGLFLSRDNGGTLITSWKDKNKNLNLKQFYSIAIHPIATNYFLAGAQDNGSHQFKQPGLGYTTEVTGGDGAYVDIDQVDPQFQFTSYIRNQYRRSINNGLTWTSFDFSTSGRFINPFTYDGISKKFYADQMAGQVRRWENPTTANSVGSSTSTILTISALNSLEPSAFAISPKVANKLYVATGSSGSTARLVYISNADTVTNAYVNANTTNITGPWTGLYINCVAVGSSSDGAAEPLIATFTNYGTTNVWYSANGGTSWVGCDGNLPDMPVRWAVFDPNNSNRAIIATEAGIYSTQNLNGAATVWTVSPGFPTVRVDMIKYRPSDGLLAAATHGRGVFTTTINQVLPINNVTLRGNLAGEGLALLNWTTAGETNRTRYILQYSTDGVSFTKIGDLPYNIKQYRHSFQAATGYYRIMAVEPNQAAIFSNIVAIQNTGKVKGLQVKVLPNPVTNAGASFVVSNSEPGKFNWVLFDMQGRTLQTGNGNLNAGGSQSQTINNGKLPAGMYRIKLVQGGQTSVVAFMKQ
jgi:trimeric autotransporter adhesin